VSSIDPLCESVDDDNCRTAAFLSGADCEISAILNIAIQKKNQMARPDAAASWQKTEPENDDGAEVRAVAVHIMTP